LHPKSLEMLEFPKVREILAGFTDFSASEELAQSLAPSTDADEVKWLLETCAEARRLLELESSFSLRDAVDVRAPVAAAARGKMLEGKALHDIGRTLAAVRLTRARLSRKTDKFPRLGEMAARLREQPFLEAEINRSVTATGEVLDGASRELSALRSDLKDRHRQLRQKLDNIIKSEGKERILQDNIITERQGRYVVPVKNEMKREMAGIIHDVSNTGATVFIEPMATVEMGNELRQLTLAERREIERILTSLSASVAACEDEINEDISVLANIDLALAKARYGQRCRASEPIIEEFRDGPRQPPVILRLSQARHPLLGAGAVPLDIEIGSDYRGIIITGPNTGGKTVALKCVGLLTLMAQAGMPIPALPESRIPVFDDIYADIGDEQSIEQTLSTFSWHMGNIVNIVGHTTARSLILLDELGASTDPTEGAALAQSILRFFLERGSMLVATTHFSELKAFAFATDGLENASMDFDPDSLKPTYHLTVGVPGGSNALSVAAGLGLPEGIVNAARDLMSKGPQELESLLAELRDERHQLEKELAAARHEKQTAASLKDIREKELKEAREASRATLREQRDHLVTESAELRRLVRDAAAELRKARSRESVENARRTLSRVQQDLSAETWQPPVAAGEEAFVDTPIGPGDTLEIIELGVTGKVTSIDNRNHQVEVQVGTTSIRMNQDSVRKIASASKIISPRIAPRQIIPSRAVALELDLRGKRADEIAPAVEKYLDDACLSALSEVRIIHGFGTGVVRQIVRDILSTHPLAGSFRPGERGEGGDGATVIKLADQTTKKRRK
jgi:DNA mismatch repair protein MutS2